MTSDDILRMAREAAGDDWGLFRDFMPEIELLAVKIEAHVREEKAEELYKEGWFACARILRGARAE